MTDASDFGRYAAGRTAGYLQGAPTTPQTVAQLVASAAASRAAITFSAAAVVAAQASLGVTTTPADVASAVQAHVAALAQACPDPATRVRLLATLARFSPGGPAAASSAGSALSALYRRAAIAQLAVAGSAYAPASYDDAVATRTVITDAIDAEMEIAGDTEADSVFAALRTLRQNVVLDLQQRGAALPRLQALVSAAPQPDVALAMRRYGDPARAAELVTQANPPHPLFMPVDFLALAS